MSPAPCRTILAVLGLGAVLLLAACSGHTTGATNIAQQTDGSYSVRLNAIGSCDQSCSAFMRWRRVGTTAWTNGPTTNDIPAVSDAHWYQDAGGLAQRTRYEYQVCGKESSWSDFVCVGPSGSAPDTFSTGAPALTGLSSDPYTNASSQHATEVEPDTFSSGSTIVSTFQVGRFFDGGATNVGWARSTDSGATWTKGFLPGITTFAGGTYARVSDASVAYDAAHKAWLIVSLPLPGAGSGGAVVANRSTDGGATWGNPVTVAQAGIGNAGTNLDKTWVACDNTATSPYYGHCYVEWDDNGNGNRVKMSTSADGGLSWGAARETANAAGGLGGQPLVQPNGTVVVPLNNANETAILAFRSTNGGASWGNAITVSSISTHTVAGNLRTGPLPSAEMDAAGRTYVVWQDCRFRGGCAANDIVMTTSADGVTWSRVVRIPTHSTAGTFDHFIPGLAVDRSTAGASAHLALAFYYYPNAGCTASTCQLDAGFTSSSDGGQTWTSPIQVAGPLQNTWLANTNQGYMVGDYISTSFASGGARPVFASATPPSGAVFAEAMFTSPSAAATPASARPATQPPVVSSSSDRPATKAALRQR